MDIAIRNLVKSFGSVAAVQDITLDIAAGRVTGLLGPNGAGKTTTLRVALALMRADSGSVLIGGEPYERLREPRRAVGAVLETTGFHPGRRGRDHLRILAQAGGIPETRVAEVLDLVELTDAAGRRVGGYSLGMRQRLGLAAALLGDPQVLILDEPGNGLDPRGMAWLRTLLRDMAGAGRTVVVSSHVLAEVAQTADDIVIISGGRLRYAGALASLRDQAESLESAFLTLTSS